MLERKTGEDRFVRFSLLSTISRATPEHILGILGYQEIKNIMDLCEDSQVKVPDNLFTAYCKLRHQYQNIQSVLRFIDLLPAESILANYSEAEIQQIVKRLKQFNLPVPENLQHAFLVSSQTENLKITLPIKLIQKETRQLSLFTLEEVKL